MAPPSAKDVQTMTEQWSGADQTALIRTMYHKMFQAHPEWAALFKKFSVPASDSDKEFIKQVELTRGRLGQAAGLVATDQAKLQAELKKMAAAHKGYGVTQEEFQSLKPIFKDALQATVPGADVDAWGATVDFILDSIQ